MSQEKTTHWERFAIQDLSPEELYRFYERSGIYQNGGGMRREDADKRAYLSMVNGRR